jgi:membrane protein YdbS with pleckstrin-like domain
MSTIGNTYRLIMDSDRNPLRRLPKAQRFQIMTMLSMMWTLIFSVGIGSWAWFGELVVFHLAVLLGMFITGWTFGNAKKDAP